MRVVGQDRNHCDNRSCVRPDHLFEGTDADNMADMIAKGRQVHEKGERASNAKLTEVEVQQIRSLKDRLSNKKCASLYGVDDSVISRVRSKQAWSHVSEDDERGPRGAR